MTFLKSSVLLSRIPISCTPFRGSPLNGITSLAIICCKIFCKVFSCNSCFNSSNSLSKILIQSEKTSSISDSIVPFFPTNGLRNKLTSKCSILIASFIVFHGSNKYCSCFSLRCFFIKEGLIKTKLSLLMLLFNWDKFSLLQIFAK